MAGVSHDMLESKQTVNAISGHRDHSNDLDHANAMEMAQTQDRSVSKFYLLSLTIGAGGLQMIWTTLSGHGSMYLSTLELPRYTTSFIWLAGPICGALIQPYFCFWSDRCRHPWGRRKPFIFFGALVAIIAMLLLPWTAELATLVSQTSGSDGYQKAGMSKGIIAALLIWTVNIALQPIQMGIRALICESCPKHQQSQVTAYSSCISSTVMVFGFAVGTTKSLPLLPWSAENQFKYICLVASSLLGSTVLITLCVVREQPISPSDKTSDQSFGPLHVFRQYRSGLARMPLVVRKVYQVQFFAWLGWFPFLFYITTYFAGLSNQDTFVQSPDLAPNKIQSLMSEGAVQSACFAMLLFGSVALCCNIVLLLVAQSSGANEFQSEAGLIKSIPLLSSLTIPRALAFSHLLSATMLLATGLTRSTTTSTLLISSLGISWALTHWAPMTLINKAVKSHLSQEESSVTVRYQDVEAAGECQCPATPTCEIGKNSFRIGTEQKPAKSDGIQTGTVMGLYNLSVAAPQILAALGSSFMFWAAGQYDFDDTETVGWVIRSFAFAGFIAAYLANGITMLQHK